MLDGRRPVPTPLPASEPYWQAGATGRLVLPRLPDGRWDPYPRPGRTTFEWQTLSGRGVVHSFSVVHISPYADLPAPYVVALIDLEDGPRVTSNLVDVDPEQVTIGMAVRVTFVAIGEHQVPVFSTADV